MQHSALMQTLASHLKMFLWVWYKQFDATEGASMPFSHNYIYNIECPLKVSIQQQQLSDSTEYTVFISQTQ